METTKTNINDAAKAALGDVFDSLSDFLTVNEVATYLRCDNVTVRNLIQTGELDRIKLSAKKVLVTKNSVRKLIAKRIKQNGEGMSLMGGAAIKAREEAEKAKKAA
jgi:excisionase family DNA binding protein